MQLVFEIISSATGVSGWDSSRQHSYKEDKENNHNWNSFNFDEFIYIAITWILRTWIRSRSSVASTTESYIRPLKSPRAFKKCPPRRLLLSFRGVANPTLYFYRIADIKRIPSDYLHVVIGCSSVFQGVNLTEVLEEIWPRRNVNGFCIFNGCV